MDTSVHTPADTPLEMLKVLRSFSVKFVQFRLKLDVSILLPLIDEQMRVCIETSLSELLSWVYGFMNTHPLSTECTW